MPNEPTALLSAQIASRLRTMIASEELRVGDRLRERDLAAQLQVSRTPLREALKILASDGLVTLLPNRGGVVTALSAAEIEEKLDVLGVLECFAGERACEVATDEELAELSAIHHEMLAARERRDRRAYFLLNQRIHLGIVAAAHNASLVQAHGKLNDQLYQYRYQGSSDESTWQVAIDEHADIIALLRRRDGAALGPMLRDHIRSTWKRLHAGMTGA